jgi:hypothetical protein
MEARVNLFGDPGRTFHGVAQEIAWRVLPLSGHTLVSNDLTLETSCRDFSFMRAPG